MKAKPFPSETLHIRLEEEKRRPETLAERHQSTTEAGQRRLKELHWMHCPKCGQRLATEHCGSVEIDLCPGCEGLWLDANELETILARAGQGGFFRACLKLFRGR